MPLPGSGQISLSQVNTELGLSSTAQINMGRSDVRTLFAVPSGQISMSDGHGKSNLAVSFSDQFIAVGNTGASHTGKYRINSSGVVEQAEDSSYTTLETWLIGGTAADFEVRATVTSGSLTSGSTGVWESLSTSREWTRLAINNTAQTVVFTIEVRRVTDSVIVDTVSITINVDNT